MNIIILCVKPDENIIRKQKSMGDKALLIQLIAKRA
ncbi:hypothetical protein QOZ91_001526 [Clostridium sardiniense]|nr:hypothetical protein [Clostridium sardiniense]